MKNTMYIVAVLLMVACSGLANADSMNGHVDNSTDAFGLYYQITGGKFVNGQTYNGDNASGGVFR